MATIGMLYICTGKYTVFWPEFYETFSRNFLPGCKKEYFVFTDAPSIAHEDDPAVHRIDQPAYDWPLSTMKRFAIFLTQEKALEQLDYLFFFNANLTCREVITPEEFLPRPQQGEQLLLVQQPGFWNKKPTRRASSLVRRSLVGTPSMSTWPASGLSRPFIRRIVVDFPAPFVPTNATNSPSRMVKLTPFRMGADPS